MDASSIFPAAVTAVVSLTVVVVSSSTTRRIANEERGQARKAAAYLLMADFVNRAREIGERHMPDTDEATLPIWTDEQYRDMHAQVTAFGSPAARQKVDEIQRQRRLIANRNASWVELRGLTNRSREETQQGLRAMDAASASRADMVRMADEAQAIIDDELNAISTNWSPELMLAAGVVVVVLVAAVLLAWIG